MIPSDPICSLPDELVLKIFSFLNITTLGKICLVSRDWRRLAHDPILQKTLIYRDIAFGSDKWVQGFEKDVVYEELSSLPKKDFITDFAFYL